MTTIRATCPSCGDVRLKASDVVVRVCANDNKGSYCFRCPSCGLRVTKSADSRIVDLLASSGVKMDVWHLPAELWEAYVEAWPPDPGYERRRPALQLHKFLNNIRHFGPDRYVPRIEAVLDGYGW